MKFGIRCRGRSAQTRGGVSVPLAERASGGGGPHVDPIPPPTPRRCCWGGGGGATPPSEVSPPRVCARVCADRVVPPCRTAHRCAPYRRRHRGHPRPYSYPRCADGPCDAARAPPAPTLLPPVFFFSSAAHRAGARPVPGFWQRVAAAAVPALPPLRAWGVAGVGPRHRRVSARAPRRPAPRCAPSAPPAPPAARLVPLFCRCCRRCRWVTAAAAAAGGVSCRWLCFPRAGFVG